MAIYLVVHSPRAETDERLRPPTRLQELARDHGRVDSSPRWIKTWSPDLHDERVISMWDAKNADQIKQVVFDYGFLDHLDAHAIQVQEWGPEQVLGTDD